MGVGPVAAEWFVTARKASRSESRGKKGVGKGATDSDDKVCYHFRKTGKCPREDEGCRFEHPAELKR